MWLARYHNKAVRAPYMSPGWSVRWIASGKGWFNINPKTGSNYMFTPQQIDHAEKWSVL